MKKLAKPNENDHKNDKFYTNPDVVGKIMKYINLDAYDLIIEPSAGSGVFLDYFGNSNYLAYDIHPEDTRITKANWFDVEIDERFKSVLIIGNPPFGKNNKLSKEFIIHSSSFKNVKTISFVLPEVYRKHTLQEVIPNEFKIAKIIKLPKNSFSISNQLHHVPCSFFILERDYKGTDLRQNKSKTSRDFYFSNRDDYDFFIFGAAPKKIIKSPNKNNRGYYIKSKIGDALEKRFKSMDWEGFSSANGGVYWLTKVDIVENYNKNKRRKKWIIKS